MKKLEPIKIQFGTKLFKVAPIVNEIDEVVDYALLGDSETISAYRDRIYEPNLSLYNATPVQLLVNASKKALFIADGMSNTQPINNFFNASSTESEVQLSSSHYQQLLTTLSKLDVLLNSIPPNADQAVVELNKLLQELNLNRINFINQLNDIKINGVLVENLEKQLADSHDKITTQLLAFQTEQKTEEEKQLNSSAIHYLFSAQDRDPNPQSQIYSLGHFLNAQSLAISEAMIAIIAVPSLGNTQVGDNFVLSPLPQAFAEAKLAIEQLGGLAYQQHVDTYKHFNNTPDPLSATSLKGQIFGLHIGSKLESMNGVAVSAFFHRLAKEPIEHKATLFNISERVIDYFKNWAATLYNEATDDTQEPKNKLVAFAKLAGVTLFSVLLPIPLSLTASLAKWLALGIIGPSMALTADLIFNIISGGKWYQSRIQTCLNRYQNGINSFEINQLKLDDTTREFLLTYTRIPDYQLSRFLIHFFQNLDLFSSQVAQDAPLILANGKSIIQTLVESYKQHRLDEIQEGIRRFKADQERQAGVQQVADQKPVASDWVDIYPEPLNAAVHIGNSPVIALNEVVLGLNDAIISRFREYYPLPSAAGYAIACSTFGLNAVLPAAIVAKMGLTQLAHTLLIPTSAVGKHFLGHGALGSDATNQFFALLLQWKFANLTVELAKELSEQEKTLMDTLVNNFQYYVPALAVGTAGGMLIGMLPTSDSPFAFLSNFIIDEAKNLSEADYPLNAIGYTFAAGKLSFLLYSQIATSEPSKLRKEKEKTIAQLTYKTSVSLRENASQKEIILQQFTDDLSNVLNISFTAQEIEYIKNSFEVDPKEMEAALQCAAKLSDETQLKEFVLTSPKETFSDKFSELLQMIISPYFDEQMTKLHDKDKRAFFAELHQQLEKHKKTNPLNTELYENLERTFFNRYLRQDYWAIRRVPVGLFYFVGGALVRDLLRDLRSYLADEKDKASIDQEHAIERAIDRVFFDDWSGLVRRTGYNIAAMSAVTIRYTVQLGLGLPLFVLSSLFWIGACLAGKPEFLAKSNPFSIAYNTSNILINAISKIIDRVKTGLLKGVNTLLPSRVKDATAELTQSIPFDFLKTDISSYPTTADRVHKAAFNTDLSSAVLMLHETIKYHQDSTKTIEKGLSGNKDSSADLTTHDRADSDNYSEGNSFFSDPKMATEDRNLSSTESLTAHPRS